MKHLATLTGVFLCSSVSFATTLPPARPTNLTLTAVSSSQIKLSWTDNSNNETGFKIERSRDGTTFVQKYVVGANVTAYSDSGRQAATKYYYRVRAYDSGGDSGYSNTANATTATTLAQLQFYIAIRTDGFPGSGTQADPYDGSTPAKFDAIMSKLQAVPNPAIHLVGRGPFRTYATHKWFVHSGWVVSGDGMYSTTVQLTGSVSGMHDVVVFDSDPKLATNNVTFRNLTIDCNWPQLSATADLGLRGEKNCKISAILLFGSNNLLDHVRSINTYSSLANDLEEFALALVGPPSGDGTNDVIQYCRAEMPQGNHEGPFSLAGFLYSTPKHLLTNSKVLSCTAVGVYGALSTSPGFASGGVNLANVKGLLIDSKNFRYCFGAAYIDTGSVDGLQVTNNTVTRGWLGVGLLSPVIQGVKQNITISGNNFLIQNRISNGASYGIAVGYGPTTNLTIDSNTVTFDTSGPGILSFWGITGGYVTSGTVSNNIVGRAPQLNNGFGVSTVVMFNNRYPDGTLIPELNNR